MLRYPTAPPRSLPARPASCAAARAAPHLARMIA